MIQSLVLWVLNIDNEDNIPHLHAYNDNILNKRQVNHLVKRTHVILLPLLIDSLKIVQHDMMILYDFVHE